jgi:hypothetical protein
MSAPWERIGLLLDGKDVTQDTGTIAPEAGYSPPAGKTRPSTELYKLVKNNGVTPFLDVSTGQYSAVVPGTRGPEVHSLQSFLFKSSLTRMFFLETGCLRYYFFTRKSSSIFCLTEFQSFRNINSSRTSHVFAPFTADHARSAFLLQPGKVVFIKKLTCRHIENFFQVLLMFLGCNDLSTFKTTQRRTVQIDGSCQFYLGQTAGHPSQPQPRFHVPHPLSSLLYFVL